MLEQYYTIAKINWKHNLFPHCIAASLLCVISPLLMGIKNLDELQVAKILEFYLCFLGVILIVPLFLPDTNKDIRDLIASKKIPITVVRFVRLAEAGFCLSIILAIYLLALKAGNCEFRYGACFYAVIANAVCMGGLGLFIYSMIDNIALAYMIPLLYYIISMGSGEKYLGKFYLMGFVKNGSAGIGLEGKPYLLAAGIIMIIAALLIRMKRRN